jgi:hypothetical protein
VITAPSARDICLLYYSASSRSTHLNHKRNHLLESTKDVLEPLRFGNASYCHSCIGIDKSLSYDVYPTRAIMISTKERPLERKCFREHLDVQYYSSFLHPASLQVCQPPPSTFQGDSVPLPLPSRPPVTNSILLFSKSVSLGKPLIGPPFLVATGLFRPLASKRLIEPLPAELRLLLLSMPVLSVRWRRGVISRGRSSASLLLSLRLWWRCGCSGRSLLGVVEK